MPSALLSAATALAAAAGQAGFSISVRYEPGQNAVSPSHPTASVRISAFFPPQDYALAGTRLEFSASDGRWDWAESLFTIFDPPRPVIMGTRVAAVGGQLNFPQAMIFADPSNPYPAFAAQWTTDDFRRRVVDVRTLTSRFDVYPLRSSPSSFSRMSMLVEGAAAIRVVPAPSSALFIAVAIAACRRKRPAPVGRACIGGSP